MATTISLLSGDAFAPPPSGLDDITPCCACDERYDGPRLCADCQSRYSRIEATEYPDRDAEDAAWFDLIDDTLTQLSRVARRAS